MRDVEESYRAGLGLRGPEIGAKLHEWLYEQIRSAILDGRLKRGATLPPTRDLANHYGLSRGTAVAAFDLLKSEGYLEGRMGARTYVCNDADRSPAVAPRMGRSRRLAGLMTIPDIEAGIYVTALLARGLKSDAMAAALAAVNVETIPIRQFVLATARPEALLLGFAPYDARQMRDGVDRMASVIDQHLRNSRPRRRCRRDG